MDEQQEKQRVELRGASPEADRALPSVQPDAQEADSPEMVDQYIELPDGRSVRSLIRVVVWTMIAFGLLWSPISQLVIHWLDPSKPYLPYQLFGDLGWLLVLGPIGLWCWFNGPVLRRVKVHRSDDSALHLVRAVRRCSVDWERMEGDDCVRYCNGCKFKVFKLEDNKPELLEQLTQNAEIGRGERIKAIYRRFDSTYMFDDCERERAKYLTGVLVIPPFLLGLVFVMAPGIFGPAFFGSAYGRAMLAAYFGWYFFGCWLFMRTLSKHNRWFLIVIFGITLPMIIPGLSILPNFIQSIKTW